MSRRHTNIAYLKHYEILNKYIIDNNYTETHLIYNYQNNDLCILGKKDTSVEILILHEGIVYPKATGLNTNERLGGAIWINSRILLCDYPDRGKKAYISRPFSTFQSAFRLQANIGVDNWGTSISAFACSLDLLNINTIEFSVNSNTSYENPGLIVFNGDSLIYTRANALPVHFFNPIQKIGEAYYGLKAFYNIPGDNHLVKTSNYWVVNPAYVYMPGQLLPNTTCIPVNFFWQTGIKRSPMYVLGNMESDIRTFYSINSNTGSVYKSWSLGIGIKHAIRYFDEVLYIDYTNPLIQMSNTKEALDMFDLRTLRS